MNNVNKIIIDNVTMNSSQLLIENKIKHLEVYGSGSISIFNQDINSLEILVHSNSNLNFNYFNNVNELKTNITIKLEDNAILKFNYAFIIDNKYDINVDTTFNGSNSNIDLNLFFINNNDAFIKANGYVSEKGEGNILNETIKGINIGTAKTVCNPNLFVETSKVLANHANTIGAIDEDEIFYMQSKGLSKSAAEKLICDGFICSTINDSELKIKIKEYLNGR